MGLGYGVFGRWQVTVAPFCEEHSGPSYLVEDHLPKNHPGNARIVGGRFTKRKDGEPAAVSTAVSDAEWRSNPPWYD
jgi:hypothetical protein